MPTSPASPAPASPPAPEPAVPPATDHGPPSIPPEAGPSERLQTLLGGRGSDALVARYLEQHGRWEVHTHRVGDPAIPDHKTTRTFRAMVWCGCPICTDARAALKLEE